MKVLVKDLKSGNRIALEDGEIATVTKLVTGDQSPFGKTGIGRFYQPNPMTIYYKDSKGEKGYAIAGAKVEVELQ